MRCRHILARSVAAGALSVGLSAATVGAQSTRIPIHDPVMIRQDSTYYVFATGPGITVWSSPDMKDWTHLAPVFDSAPAWTHEVVPRFRNGEWAPDIAFHDGTYYLYYAVSAFGRNTSAIGVATNKTLDPDDPDFHWVDHGMVIESVPGRDLWNAIDPNLAFDADGTPWLDFGSFWTGIKLVKLRPDLLRPAEPEEWHSVAARQRYWKLPDNVAGDEMNGAIEAPFIFHKGDWYYLFVSWDRCCRGVNSTYKVVVGRSKDITGPYLDAEEQEMRLGGGTLVAAGDGTHWAAVGHCGVYDFDGTDYLVMHGYDATDEGRSKLLIEEIRWDAYGWPHITLR